MKISCDKRDLRIALGTALKAVPNKAISPMMEKLLIEAGDDIRITGNDAEMGIESKVQGYVEYPGMIAVDAKILFEIVSKMPNGDVSISTDENYVVTVQCGKSKFDIPGNDGDGFLKIPETGNAISRFKITEAELRALIRKTIFCTAPNETNKMMTGELLEVSDGNLRAVALDGHRVAICNAPVSDVTADAKAIVPGKTLNELQKILTDSQQYVDVTITKMHVMFDLGDSIIVSRTIEGTYFSYERMIEADLPIKIMVISSDLVETVGRVSIVIREGDKKPLVFSLDDGIAKISAKTQLGAVKEEIELESHEGDNLTIGFNPRFLLDVMNVIGDEKVTMEFSSPKTPCYIRNKEEGYTYLVLPVAV